MPSDISTSHTNDTEFAGMSNVCIAGSLECEGRLSRFCEVELQRGVAKDHSHSSTYAFCKSTMSILDTASFHRVVPIMGASICPQFLCVMAAVCQAAVCAVASCLLKALEWIEWIEQSLVPGKVCCELYQLVYRCFV